jgi:hypothetical protein
VISFHGIHTLANVIIVDPIIRDLVLRVALFREVVATMVAQTKKGFHQDQYMLQTCFSLLPLRSLGVYINKPIIFSIIVLTWLG